MKKSLILLACLALSLTSCKFIRIDGSTDWTVVHGNENIVTKTLDLGPFDEVSLSMSADVIYSEITDTTSVTVSAPDNVFEYFDFTVEKGVLKLRYKKDVKAVRADRIVITLTAPTLREVAVAGSGDFRADVPIVTGSFEGAVAGSGDIRLSRVTAGEVSLAIAGSGDLQVTDLDCTTLSAAIAGSGDMRLSGKTGKAEVSVSGSGDMDIRTLAVEDLKTSVAGSGDILR